MQDRVLSMLGLGTKARALVSGEFSVEKAVKEGRAWLVIVADDASENAKKNYTNLCEFYECPLHFYGDKERLGRAIGKEFRASVAVVDENFAKGLEGLL